jgi:hypothetical protein
VSIDFTDPARNTMLAGVHEVSDQLAHSTDAGVTWTNIGAALPAGLGFCTTTLVLDAKNFLVGCDASWSGKAGAILRSADGGKTFAIVQSDGVVEQPLWASDGTIYWDAENGGIYKSTDIGQTWTLVKDGSAAGTLRPRPMEIPDGRIASVAGQSVVVSADHGATWTQISTAMPITPVGGTYSPFRRAFYFWYFTCDTNVPSDALQRFGWDFKN